MFKAQMDSRLRGNEDLALGHTIWFLEASPEAAWILALQACHVTSKPGYADWLTQYEMSSRAKRGDLVFQPWPESEIASSLRSSQ